MTSLRIGATAVLVALAVLAALGAADVRRWHTAIAGGDVAYAATPARASWTPDARLGSAAEKALGVSDDVEFRRALQLYVDAAKLRLRLDNAVDVESARANAQDALERASRAADPRRRSQALTLLGILAFRASASGGTQSQVDAAIADFTDAVRADPANEEASFDLELLLRLIAAHGSRIEPGQGGGFGRTGHRGAGGGRAGSGY